MQANPGDKINYERLLKIHRKKLLFNPTELSEKVHISGEQLYPLLPHRKPFLHIDSITSFDREKMAATGEKHIPVDDPVFEGHFPGDPIYPGVLLMEAVGQLGIALMNLVDSTSDAAPAYSFIRATRILNSYFLAPVRPGSKLTILGYRSEWDGITARFIGQAICDQTIMCIVAGEICVGR